jgi:Ca2+-transporting ATPase
MSVILALGALLACLFGVGKGLAHAQTMTLSALVVFEFVRVQMVRAQYGVPFFANLWVLGALLCSFALQLVIVYTPSLQVVFRTAPLGWVDWMIIALIALGVWGAGSFVNHFFKRFVYERIEL